MKRLTVQNPLEEIRQYKKRVIVIIVIMAMLLMALITRLIYLQVNQHFYYLTLSKQNLLSMAPVDPSRGLIYDRNGVLLAGNVPVFSLEMTPSKIHNVKQTVAELSQLIYISPADMQAFDKQMTQLRFFNNVTVKVKLTETEMAIFAVNQYRFPNVYIQAHMVRYYPYGPLLEPVLGYVGRINASELAKVDPANYSASNFIGKSGVEKYYEPLLHGTVGIQQIETSADGNVVRSNQSRPAVAGSNLYLSIDMKLQVAAQQGLDGESGAVVAIDPRNGEILAMVSKPSFDPNQFVTGISNQAYAELQRDPGKPLYNRALQGEFPPGSTIKPLYALEALISGVVTPTYRLFCAGTFQLPGSSHIYHDWVHHRGHGWVSIERAVVVSCDVFFYHLAENSGITRMDDIMTKFGYGQPTGVDTTNERSGLVPSPEWKMRAHHEAWYPGDTVITGIGQGYLLITPLQLANVGMRLVDRGGGYQVHFLMRSVAANGKVTPHIITPLKPIDLPPEDIDLVLRAMREVVSSPGGTGYGSGHDAPYTYGGKSGTAQVFSLKGGTKDTAKALPVKLRDHSWFISFTPANNPTVVMAVFVENGGEGKAPVLTRKILDAYYGVANPNDPSNPNNPKTPNTANNAANSTNTTNTNNINKISKTNKTSNTNAANNASSTNNTDNTDNTESIFN